MAGSLHAIFRIVVSLVVVTMALASCHFGSLMPLWGPPEGPSNPFQTVHVTDVEIPSVVVRNVSAVLTLHLTTEANPHMLGNEELRARIDSDAFDQGVVSGRYEAGHFYGLYTIPHYAGGNNVELGQVQSEIHLPIIFSESGRQVIYFGHNRNSYDGGKGINLYPDMSNEYPAESDFIEYLKVLVEVQP